MTVVSISERTPSPAPVLADTEHVYSVNAVRFSKVALVTEPLMMNGGSTSEDVAQYMVYLVITPFVGSGITHEAESVFENPCTIASIKILGADGTA